MSIDRKKVLAFAGGSLQPADAPAWFENALNSEEQDWSKLLAEQGLTEVETFGRAGDVITIYRSPNGYYVEMMDVCEATAYVFIDTVQDYLRFRIEWIKPLVELSDIADRQAARDIDRESDDRGYGAGLR
jgi:hypothetical protein